MLGARVTREYREWTAAEDNRIRLNYERVSATDLGMLMGRTSNSVQHRAMKLGVQAEQPHDRAPRLTGPVQVARRSTGAEQLEEAGAELVVAWMRPAVAEGMLVAADERPAAGTACDWCGQAGHYCQARRYWVGDGLDVAICAACAAGEPCSVAQAAEAGEDAVLSRYDRPCSVVRNVTPVDASQRVAPVVKVGRLMPYEVRRVVRAKAGYVERPRAATRREAERMWMNSTEARSEDLEELEALMAAGVVDGEVKKEGTVKKTVRITDGVKDKIKARAEKDSAYKIALDLGIPHKTCAYYVTKYRKGKALGSVPERFEPVAKKAAVKVEGNAGDKAPSAEQMAQVMERLPDVGANAIDIVDVSERIAALSVPAQAPDYLELNMLVMCTPAKLDRWWAQLSLAEKAMYWRDALES